MKTPRTDALINLYSGTSAAFTFIGELEKLCRQLERELNALDDALRERDKQVIALTIACGVASKERGEWAVERDELQRENDALRQEVDLRRDEVLKAEIACHIAKADLNDLRKLEGL